MLTKTQSPSRIRILFFSYDDTMGKLVSAYSKLFKSEGMITHCQIQIDNEIHEIAKENCLTSTYVGDVLQLKYIVGYYEFDLSQVTDDELAAAEFCVRQDISTQRKFKPMECLCYALNYIGWDFRRQLQTEEFVLQTRDVDLTLKPGIRKYGQKFHYIPPFTCATQAADLIERLYGLEVGCECHLPDMVFAFCCVLDANAIGQLVLEDSFGVQIIG